MLSGSGVDGVPQSGVGGSGAMSSCANAESFGTCARASAPSGLQIGGMGCFAASTISCLS